MPEVYDMKSTTKKNNTPLCRKESNKPLESTMDTPPLLIKGLTDTEKQVYGTDDIMP